jgi:hypothetical protein
MTGIEIALDHPILKHARKAKDGKHYVPDIYRPGKYLRVDWRKGEEAEHSRRSGIGGTMLAKLLSMR